MVKSLSLCLERNGGQVAEVVVLDAVKDGFEVFGISPVGDTHTGDLALLCHIYCLLFLHNGIIRKLIPGDSAAYLYEANDPFRINTCLRNLIQGLLYEFFPMYLVSHSFYIVLPQCREYADFTKLQIMWYNAKMSKSNCCAENRVSAMNF